MKISLIMCVAGLVAVSAKVTGTELSEIESAGVAALTNSDYLCSSSFSNTLVVARNSADVRVSAVANMLVGIRARLVYLNTADEEFLQEESSAISNAVASTSVLANDWRRELAILMYSGCCSTANNFVKSYEVLTNELNVITNAGSVVYTNPLLDAMLAKYEMPGISLPTAYKIFAGMSAAKLDKKDEALQFANQVPELYSTIIRRFANAKNGW